MARCLLVSYEPSNGPDHGVLVVGEQNEDGKINILNAFSGERALNLFEQLLAQTAKVEEKENIPEASPFTCDKCRYLKRYPDDVPCDQCHDHSNFKPLI